LYLAPFAEEMNRARRMAALQARILAERGIGVLILDPFGTGDSEGGFEEARWEIWRSDTRGALAWLRAQGYERLTLLGLRLGACLALAVAAEPTDGEVEPSRLVLWQPVLRGDAFLNQFLRIRVMTGLRDNGSGAKETVKELRRRLDSGETLEVAGYPLTPGLSADIAALNAVDLALACPRPLDWIDLVAQPEAEFAPATRTALERLRTAGCAVEAQRVPGEPFWTIEEPALVPELWRRTADLWDRPPS
jgi:exosortase A-associated hydrolase 2